MKRLEDKAIEWGVKIVDLSASLIPKKFYDSLGYITQAEKSLDVKNNKSYIIIKWLNL